MKAGEAGQSPPPEGVRLLLLGARLAQWYALLMAAPLLVVGSFAGPVVIGAGVVHLLAGLALLAARRGVARGDRASLWLLRLVSILIALPLPAFAIEKAREPALGPSSAIFPAIVAACGVALLLISLRRDVRDQIGAPEIRG